MATAKYTVYEIWMRPVDIWWGFTKPYELIKWTPDKVQAEAIYNHLKHIKERCVMVIKRSVEAEVILGGVMPDDQLSFHSTELFYKEDPKHEWKG